MEKLDLFLVIDDLNLKQQQVIPINLKTKGLMFMENRLILHQI